MRRFHVTTRHRRTTVTLDGILVELLALRLGCTPDTPEAHRAVREWMQGQLAEPSAPSRKMVSQWLRGRVIEAIADKKISRRRDDWLLGEGPWQ